MLEDTPAMIIDIDPRVDIVFKKLFGSPDHPAITLSFVNGILEAARLPRAVSLRVENPFRLADFRGGKSSELDILYTNELGTEIQLEMQIESHTGIARRMIHNWTQLYGRQLEQGQDYNDHRPAVSIWILNQKTFDDGDAWFHVFTYCSLQTGLVLHGDATIITIELPVWARRAGFTAHEVPEKACGAPDDTDATTTALSATVHGAILEGVERWNWFLTRAGGQQVDTVTRILPDPVFSEAVQIMTDFTKQRALRHAYDMRRNYEHIVASYKRTGYDAGLVDGKAEGKSDIVRRMLARGMSLDVIADITGLTDKELGDLVQTYGAG